MSKLDIFLKNFEEIWNSFSNITVEIKNKMSGNCNFIYFLDKNLNFIGEIEEACPSSFILCLMVLVLVQYIRIGIHSG